MSNIAVYEKYFEDPLSLSADFTQTLNNTSIKNPDTWFPALALLQQKAGAGAPKEELAFLFDLLFKSSADHTVSVYFSAETYDWFFKKMLEVLTRVGAVYPEALLEKAVALLMARRGYRDYTEAEKAFQQALAAGVEAAAPVYYYYQYVGLMPGGDKEVALEELKKLAAAGNPWALVYDAFYQIWFSTGFELTPAIDQLKNHSDRKLQKNYYDVLQGYYGKKGDKEKQVGLLKESISHYDAAYPRYVLAEISWPEAQTEEEKTAILKELEKAYNDGSMDAATSLGLKYLPQEPKTAQDYERSIFWLKQSWLYDNAYAAYRLAYLYLYNELVADVPAGLQLLEAAKDAGNIDAAIEWAEVHIEGRFTEINKTVTLDSFNELHTKQVPYATYRLGHFYEYGDPDLGITADLTRAFNYYKEAADQQLPVAQYNVGRFLKYGFDNNEPDVEASIPYFTKAAEANNAQACTELGLIAETSGQPDYRQAFEHFSKAAELGYPYANYIKGLYLEYDYHQSGKTDPGAAVQCYEYAAGYNEMNAAYELGRCYKFGTGTQQDFDKAIGYLRKAADANNPKALTELALSYERAEGVTEDRDKAVEYMERAAGFNYVYAQYATGRYYLHGYVQVNSAKGLEWLEKAAAYEYPYALLELGDYYMFDYDRVEQYDKAFDYYRRAKEQQVYSDGLGLCYEYGIGVETAPATAFNEYTLAAEYGNSNAKYRLGRCYYDGFGTDKNLETAFRWFGESANEGNDHAKLYLGRQYLKGEGIPRQPEKAIPLFTEAAENESANAQYELANCYLMGEGVDEDEQKAMYWFERAADNGHEGAKKLTGRRRK
ncbi:tetratricopeptide repeat protein [Niabella beijingensis]|uniref:tetratricopeptide repeat protein n=1 Tax=Niabella beijingensis TaxID=2872700 RepID=UPI001CBE2A9F|nr:tetratricopeptide repeat protein [Niabella beijingensis]MBZ4190129.1 sel1 repeat family protein [Niabella beijingensis]